MINGSKQTQVEPARFRNSEWALEVVSRDTRGTLFTHNAHEFFQPASNAKLFTAAPVLEQLGPDYRICTDLRSIARPEKQGVLHGEVIVFDRGVPAFGARWQKPDGETAGEAWPSSS